MSLKWKKVKGEYICYVGKNILLSLNPYEIDSDWESTKTLEINCSIYFKTEDERWELTYNKRVKNYENGKLLLENKLKAIKKDLENI